MKTIVISPGHGGSDPGAVNRQLNLTEAEKNLKISLACRDHLVRHYSGHKIIMCRTNDSYVSLPARRDMARGADLYVSIHNNSFRDPSANGFESFIFSGPVYDATVRAQQVIHTTVYDYLNSLGIRDRGMKRSRHWEVTNVPAPTVLLEYMFISNTREAQLLANTQVCESIGKNTAVGIARALELPTSEQPDHPHMFFRVIAGSYTNRESALRVRDELRDLGYDAFLTAFTPET